MNNRRIPINLHRRSRIGSIAGVFAVLGLLIGGAIAPVAGAQESGLAEVTVIHGLAPADVGVEGALPVDVSIDGVCFLTNFGFTEVSPTVAVPAGPHDVQIRLADGDCGGPLAIDFPGVEFDDGESSTILAHIASDGQPIASQFVDDLSGLGRNRSRVSVHHLANAAPIDATLTRTDRTDPFFEVVDLASGQQFTGDTWMGDYVVELFPAGAAERVFAAEVALVANKSLAIYVVGSAENGTVRVIGDQRITTSESIFNGVFVTVSNTFASDEITDGEEVPFGNARAERVGLGAEILPEDSDFLYVVDVESDVIDLVWDFTNPAIDGLERVIEPGTRDVYRFTFAEPVLAGVTAVADPTAPLVPTVEIVSDTEVIVTISEGMQVGDGFDARILFEKALVPTTRPADVAGVGVSGVFVTVANTFASDAITDGQFVTVGNRQAARVGPGREIDTADSGFAYNIDVDANSVSMTWDTANAGIDALERVIEPGTSDVYLFTFAEPVLAGMVAFADPASTLVPTVEVVSSTELLVVVGEGMQVGDGFDARIFLS